MPTLGSNPRIRRAFLPLAYLMAHASPTLPRPIVYWPPTSQVSHSTITLSYPHISQEKYEIGEASHIVQTSGLRSMDL